MTMMQRTHSDVTVRWSGTRRGTRRWTTRTTWRTSPAGGRTARTIWWRTSAWRRCTAAWSQSPAYRTMITWRPPAHFFTLSGRARSLSLSPGHSPSHSHSSIHFSASSWVSPSPQLQPSLCKADCRAVTLKII